VYLPHHHNNTNATNGTQANCMLSFINVSHISCSLHIILDTNVWFIQYNLDLNETLGPIDTIALGQAVSQTLINETNIKERLDI
jgi:hypothetical protein